MKPKMLWFLKEYSYMNGSGNPDKVAKGAKAEVLEIKYVEDLYQDTFSPIAYVRVLDTRPSVFLKINLNFHQDKLKMVNGDDKVLNLLYNPEDDSKLDADLGAEADDVFDDKKR